MIFLKNKEKLILEDNFLVNYTFVILNTGLEAFNYLSNKNNFSIEKYIVHKKILKNITVLQKKLLNNEIKILELIDRFYLNNRFLKEIKDKKYAVEFYNLTQKILFDLIQHFENMTNVKYYYPDRKKSGGFCFE